MRLPASWGQAKIHSSLLMTLFLLSFATLLLSVTRPTFAEFKPFVLTLPMIWVVSLTVRIAAQHFAIGSHSLDLETLLGPTGNLSTHYEDLPPRQIMLYALAGQSATIALVLLGGLVNLASIPADQTMTIGSALLDVVGGWSNRALATQIMWVNLVIAILNLLPTIPFDNRALLYSLLCRGQFGEEPAILRRLASADSHLATLLMGAGATLFALSCIEKQDYFGWYALIAAGVYLFVASRWEAARSHQLEEQYMPVLNVRQDTPARRPPAPHFGQAPRESKRKGKAVRDRAADNVKPKVQATVPGVESAPTNESDIDEILRKLHREGTGSLSIQEQEALLTASQKLKEKKKQPEKEI
ncbi:MAG: hypothetical protein U0930_05150 [Pirellulales bacterium]